MLSSDPPHSAQLPPSPPPVNAPVLHVHNLSRTYHSHGRALTVVRRVSFSIAPGETCAIVGPSGSGKTTLLGLCAGLDRPDEGSVQIVGHNLNSLSEDQCAALRRRHVGFVFQNFQLLPTLTALENVLLPLELLGQSDAHQRAHQLLAAVGLADRTEHYPAQLSGGEQQRVALARAFIHRPSLLFADEPTGNLDTATGAPIQEMLFQLNHDHGTALILVTHDPTLARRAGRTLHMRAGELTPAPPEPAAPSAAPAELPKS